MGSKDVVMVKVSRIRLDKFPFHEHTPGLREDIRKNGIKRPLVIQTLKDGNYEIRDGRHRFVCAQRLRMEEIPCYIREYVPPYRPVLFKDKPVVRYSEPVFFVPIEKLVSRQPRTKASSMRTQRLLARVVEDGGEIIVPLFVSYPFGDGKYQIWDGHHRYEVAKILHKEKLACMYPVSGSLVWRLMKSRHSDAVKQLLGSRYLK